jgi:hypothetical protein
VAVVVDTRVMAVVIPVTVVDIQVVPEMGADIPQVVVGNLHTLYNLLIQFNRHIQSDLDPVSLRIQSDLDLANLRIQVVPVIQANLHIREVLVKVIRLIHILVQVNHVLADITLAILPVLMNLILFMADTIHGLIGIILHSHVLYTDGIGIVCTRSRVRPEIRMAISSQ